MSKYLFFYFELFFFLLPFPGRPQNVLKNQGFETLGEEWTIINIGKQQSDVVKTGHLALKVSQDTAKYSGAKQVVYLPEETYRIKVSGWMKTKNVVQGHLPYMKANIAVEIKDPFGTLLVNENLIVGSASGTTKWNLYENDFYIPRGVAQIELFTFLSQCRGTAWFDDFKVLLFSKKGDTLKAAKKHLPDIKDFSMLYPQWKLKMDSKEMVVKLKTHPGVYEFSPESQFDSLVAHQFNQIKDSMTLTQFYAICAPVVAKIGCFHVQLNDWRLNVAPDSFFFPLDVWFDQEKMYVLNSSLSVPEMPNGSEILEINGRPVSEIYSTIFNSIPSDGYNESGKRMIINKNFKKQYALLFGFHETYRLTYVTYKEKERKVCSISVMDYKQPDKPHQDKTICRDEALCFKLLQESSTAVITVRHFGYLDQKLDYFKNFIDGCFNAIHDKKIRHLILDLRGNNGGSPYCSSYLLSYIIKKPITYFSKGDPYFRHLTDTMVAQKKAFAGKPYIIIDGGNFSSSGHINALIKYHDLAVFVGEETGATYTCYSHSLWSNLKYTLPYLLVPQLEMSVAVEPFPKDRGIIPDYEVKPGLDDILAGKDVVMDFVFKLIE